MTVPMAPLTDLELDVLAFIEAHWHAYDLWPSVPKILEAFPQADLVKAFSKDRFQQACKNRGLPLPPVERRFKNEVEAVGLSVEKFSPHQVAVVVTLTDYMDNRSTAVKLKSLGITSTQFNAWMRDPTFKNFFNKMSRKHFSEAQHIGRLGLIKGMEKGDVSAIKYFDEVTGESPEHKNIQVLLSRLVEAIQMHVRDPITLHKIEQSFASIMGGNTIEAEIVPNNTVAQIEAAMKNGDI